MGLYQRKNNVKTANYLVNLTDTEVKVYEDYSGSIWRFPPRRQVTLYDSKQDVYYIVTRSLLDLLQKHGVPLDNIAVIGRKDIGRKGKIVSYLSWAKDEKTTIRLRHSSIGA